MLKGTGFFFSLLRFPGFLLGGEGKEFYFPPPN